MKYEYYPKRRTEQERRELNEQILRLLQSEACEQAGVTDEDIFNRYTGDGGLHGLRRSDYENYNAFSAAKKELENGQFFTPPPLCEMIVSALRLSDTDLVADLTCGMGNFFNFLPMNATPTAARSIPMPAPLPESSTRRHTSYRVTFGTMSPKRILILFWAIRPFTCAGSCRTPPL